MNSNDLSVLSALWLDAKAQERAAIERRREIEDRIKALASVPDTLEGTKTLEHCGYTIKIVGRIDRKVDADLLQEIAAEHGLTDHLSYLFRWKPEVNTKAWQAADERITRPLMAAITTKPGRPSFTIIKKGE